MCPDEPNGPERPWSPDEDRSPDRIMGKLEGMLDRSLEQLRSSDPRSLFSTPPGALYDNATMLERGCADIAAREEDQLWSHAATLARNLRAAIAVAIVSGHGDKVRIDKAPAPPPPPSAVPPYDPADE